MSRTQPPRDAIAATDLWVPVDATGEDFYALGNRFGTQVGVLHALHKESGQPYATHEGAGFLDPWSVRWHRLQRRTLQGVDDNRLTWQTVNDYEGPYEDARPGDAPFGQPELFTSLNRTTREADLQGRVALPSSHRRIIDSEDDRYAVALTCRSVPLGTASAPEVPQEDDMTPAGTPEGVLFREAGTLTGSHGSSTTTQPSVSFGGVTFFGGAAVAAAKEALAAGGSVADAARWASAAARGTPRPPLQDAGTRTRDADGGDTRTRERPPPPDTNEGGGVPLLDHPAGYVWSLAKKVGLLGTLVCPEGAHGHYFTGREGTPIGPLPLRHDAQVTMGSEIVGRMVFVQDDAAQVPEGTGKPIKGELWQDTSRANQDTELGHETTQWRPVVRVDADLPPSRLPPEDPPPSWLDPGREEDEDEDEDDDEGGGGPPGRGGGGGGGRRRSPPVGQEDGEPPGSTGIGVIHSGGIPVPRRPEPGGDGELPPVSDPQSQARDYEGPGVPCPNATAGVFVATGTRVAISTDLPEPTLPGRGVGRPHRVPGGWIQYFGHPGLTRVPGGLIVGGEENRLPLGLPGPYTGGVLDDQGRLPLGLPGPQGGGVVVEPGPDDGVPRGTPVPGDDPGRITLGLPGGSGAGLGFEPPPGGDRGVPRGWAERQERAERKARARRDRREAERREQEEIDRLKRLEEEAREDGRANRGDRIRRHRERLEKRRQERQERQRRREEYKEKKKQEREERRRRREERKEERRRKREEERARRNRARQEREEARRRNRGSLPQGGYMIDVTDAGSEAVSMGSLPENERRRRERDQEAERRAPDSPFGHWNVLNRPVPFFGAVGGPRSLEGWAHMATFSIRALQRVTCGAFGGPGYLAGNIGVVHRNTPGNPPAGSRIGAHWTPQVNEDVLQVCEGESVLDVVSVLEAPPGKQLCACTGAVMRVARDHRGDGLIDDRRPLLLLDDQAGQGEADLLVDDRGQFRVDQARGVTATRLRLSVPCGQRGPALEVLRECEGREGSGTLAAIEEDGRLSARAGARVGRSLVLEPGVAVEFESAIPARVALSEAGLTLTYGHGEVEQRVVLGPKGLMVEGDVIVTGKVVQG